MAMTKIQRRQRIRYRIRKVVNGTPERPRMSVFRSNKQIYVQVIDDTKGITLVSAGSTDKSLEEAVKGNRGGCSGRQAHRRACCREGYLHRLFRPRRLPLSRKS